MSTFDVRIQMNVGDGWFDITDRVYQRDPITITRGRQNESGQVDPANCTMTLNNRDGRFSPRNPTGPWFGRFGRNTPIRVVAGTPTLAGGNSAIDTSTSHVAPSVDAAAETGLLIGLWCSGQSVGNYTVPAGMTAGRETDGASSTAISATSPASAGATGPKTATFAGSVAAHAQAAIVVPGDVTTPTVQEFVVDEHIASVSTGVLSVFTGDATEDGWWLVAVQMWNCDPLDQMPLLPTGTPGRWSSLLDTGPGDAPRIKAWTRRVDVAGAQRIDFATPLTTDTVDNHVRVFAVADVRYSSVRVVGEASNWPPQWDTSGTDIYVPLEVAGIMRRLGQGDAPLRSTLYRFVTRQKPAPVAYWPCEDLEGSEQIASAVQGQPPLALIRSTPLAKGVPEMASFEDFIASDPLPMLKDAWFAADVVGYTPTNVTRAQWLMNVAEEGTDVGENAPLLRLKLQGGSLFRVDVVRTTGEALEVQLWKRHPEDETSKAGKLEVAGSAAKTFTGKLYTTLLVCTLTLTQNGANIHYELQLREPGTDDGDSITGDLTKNKVGTIWHVMLNPHRLTGDIAFGHLVLRSDADPIFDLHNAIDGYAGEAAGRRIERLCAEEGVSFTNIGPLDQTTLMGAQHSDTMLNLLTECSEADGGILHETREELGLTYRTRWTLYNQGLPFPASESEGAVAGPGGKGVPVPGGGTAGGGVGGSPLTYEADFARSWNASGSMRSGSEAPLYQGQTSGNVGGHGNQKSWVWFDWEKIWADLAGRTITKAELYLYAEHWWYSAGGTAVLGFHASDHRDSYNADLDNVDEKRSGNWPVGGRWVDITGTSIAAQFQAGYAKGITIGPAPSTSLGYYGYFAPPLTSDGSISSRGPRLRFTVL